MATSKNAGKSGDKIKNQAIAARLAYLRNAKFTLEGISHHENISYEQARSMAIRNRSRLVGDGRPNGWKQPTVQI